MDTGRGSASYPNRYCCSIQAQAVWKSSLACWHFVQEDYSPGWRRALSSGVPAPMAVTGAFACRDRYHVVTLCITLLLARHCLFPAASSRLKFLNTWSWLLLGSAAFPRLSLCLFVCVSPENNLLPCPHITWCFWYTLRPSATTHYSLRQTIRAVFRHISALARFRFNSCRPARPNLDIVRSASVKTKPDLEQNNSHRLKLRTCRHYSLVIWVAYERNNTGMVPKQSQRDDEVGST